MTVWLHEKKLLSHNMDSVICSKSFKPPPQWSDTLPAKTGQEMPLY